MKAFVILILLKSLLAYDSGRSSFVAPVFFLSGVFFLLKAFKKNQSAEEMPSAVDLTLGLYILGLGLVVGILHSKGLLDRTVMVNRLFSTGLYFSLFSMSSGLLLIKKHPFTMAYLIARGYKSENAETEAAYYRAMCELSAIWSLIFLVAASVSAIAAPLVRDIVAIVVVAVVGAAIASGYPKWRIRTLCASGKEK